MDWARISFPIVIPIGEGEAGSDGTLRYDVPLEAGMVMAAEIFLTHPGVGTAGFEQNLIVTESGPGASHPHADAVLVNSHSLHEPRFDSLPRLVYVNALFIIGTLGTLITPAMLEGWSQLALDSHTARRRRRNRTRGSRRRFSIRLVLAATLALAPRGVASLIVAIAGNAACVVVRDFTGVCVLRALVGMSGGLLGGAVFGSTCQLEITGTHHRRHDVYSDRCRSGLYVLHQLGV